MRRRSTPSGLLHCGGAGSEQKPLMQRSLGSQQSPLAVHLFPVMEQLLLGGMFAQISPPSDPPGSQ
jgi:hypothetical protein